MITIPTLETERLILRAPKFEDFDAQSAFYGQERSKFVRDTEMTPTECWRALSRVAGLWVLRGYGVFVLTLKGDDTPLGIAGAFHPIDHPERELGWSLWDAKHEGHGYITEAAIACRDYVYNVHKWSTAVSYIEPENVASIKVAERLGCVLDQNAKSPGDYACLVYRHPAPEVLS